MLIFTKPLLFLLLYLYLTISYIFAQISSFPGAEGFGTTTIGGRDGKIIKVTNLHDSGPGSLRAALNEEGPRIIVFNTGGIINLETKLIIREPFVTVAGQTAPGSGICIRGERVQIATHDVIFRYLRVRPGDIDFGPPNDWDKLDAISIGGFNIETYNVVIDHCSFSWAVDENVDLWHNTHDITIQNCIISEALNNSKHPKGPHSKGMLIGGNSTDISVHHNIFAHNQERSPRVDGNSFVDFRNNVIYNSGGTASDFGNAYVRLKFININYVGNYLLKGRNTERPQEVIIRKGSEPLKIYIEDNVGYYEQPGSRSDNWAMVRNLEGEPVGQGFRMSTPFPHPSVTTHSPETAYELLLENAGAVLPERDPVDRKVVRDIKNRTGGIVNTKRLLLEWPPYDKGIAPLDSDNDGMPDHWEEAYNLNPYSTPEGRDDNLDPDGDRYTNIEEYLNSTRPQSQGKVASLSGTTFSFNESEKPEALLPFELTQNYPNPFSNSTHVKFTIPEASHVNLQVVDNKGAIVTDIINTFLYEGKYEIIWDASHLRPNMYLVVLSTGNHLKSIKSILRKE